MWDERIWNVVEDAVGRWEEAWRSGASPDLNQFLPPSDDPGYEQALVTLIKVDQEHRWTSGERPHLEKYLDVRPELKTAPGVLADLLSAECRTRAALDALPTAEELRERFPTMFGQIDSDGIAAEADDERRRSW